mmetsp:Transcript_9731/g.23564  ORF Transcript_9731/g.23564 Transcript_9731/m.23564 type:complete len:140 (+) Transcript_9731:590-1009(+)
MTVNAVKRKGFPLDTATNARRDKGSDVSLRLIRMLSTLNAPWLALGTDVIRCMPQSEDRNSETRCFESGVMRTFNTHPDSNVIKLLYTFILIDNRDTESHEVRNTIEAVVHSTTLIELRCSSNYFATSLQLHPPKILLF